MEGFDYKSIAEAVKDLGEKEALSCLIAGAKQKWYRKQKNERDRALLTAAKKDPRFRELAARKSA